MTIIKQSSDGGFYITRRMTRRVDCFWHTVMMESKGYTGIINLHSVMFPKDWIGKKVLFQVIPLRIKRRK